MKRIKYYLTLKRIDSNSLEEIEVFPFSNIIINGEKEELPKRDYMRKINGNITFMDNDYFRIITHFNTLDCTPIVLRITELCEREQTIFTTKINARSGTYDYTLCKLDLKIEEENKYKCLEDNWEHEIPFSSMGLTEKTIDALPYVNRYRINWDMRTDRIPVNVIKVYQLQSSSQTFATIMADTANEVGSNSNPTALYNLLAQRNGSLASPYYDDPTDSHAIKYRREIGSVTQYTQDKKDYIVYDFGNGVYMFARRTYRTYHTPIGTTINEYGYAFEGLGANKKSITNGRKLEEVFENLLSRYCGGMTVKSDFLQWNPTSVSNTNYVTLRTNELTNLMIFQKSDVKRPNDVNRAFGKSTNLTIKMLLENICKMFNCNYYLTDTNQLVIEHLSWSGWGSLMGYSPTQDIRNEFGYKGNDVLSYNSFNIPRGEHFEFMEQFNPDFVGRDITYPENCVNGSNVENTDIQRITTDLTALVYGTRGMYSYTDSGDGTNPNDKEIQEQKNKSISDDGFCIIACQNTSNNPVWVRAGVLAGDEPAPKPLPNNPLGWSRLLLDYYKQGRYYTTATIIDGTYVSLILTKHNASISDIKLQNCCGSFKYLAYYQTNFPNNAEVQSFEYEIESGNVILTLTTFR